MKKSKALKSTALVAFNPTTALTFYDTATQALAMAAEIDEVRQIKAWADAAAAYAKQMHDTSLLTNAREVRIRASRRVGELLIKMRLSGELASLGGDRKSNSASTRLIKTLAVIGITYDEAVLCVKRATSQTAEQQEKTLERMRAKGVAITGAAYDREVCGGNESADDTPDSFVAPKGTYDLMVISPPFQTLSIGEIRRDVYRLVSESTAENAYVWFRSPNGYLHETLELLKLCSLDYRSILTMREPFNSGLAFTLMATKGRPKPAVVNDGRRLTGYPEFSIEGFDRWPA